MLHSQKESPDESSRASEEIEFLEKTIKSNLQLLWNLRIKVTTCPHTGLIHKLTYNPNNHPTQEQLAIKVFAEEVNRCRLKIEELTDQITKRM